MSRRRQHPTYWRSGHAPGRVPPGYGERHARTAWFGTGEARLASLSSKDRSYKPVVKSRGGKRESGGVVVPPRDGKDPDFGHVGDGGKREGNFCTGNAADKFIDMDRYVAWRLHRLLVKKRGRNLRPGQADRWTRTWFHDQGLHKLMGTIRYPKAA
jgi:hypothetical protein